uniref:BRO1 domain-containing protein BROX-like n=1 Tax=Saccoglossus kowalevskii TaxID=10224 RepID=A0ABM0GL93_SACKO|nr:PREDICTED: BRO1 domain-containing protein BROX-like [Saccoglossus kowalevskii]
MAYPGSRQKRTTKVEFHNCLREWKDGVDTERAQWVGQEITRRRERLSNILTGQDAVATDAIEALRLYLEMPVQELIDMAQGESNARFYWLNIIGVEYTIRYDDAQFDRASMMMKTALWLRQRGLVILADPESVLWAAGVFDCIQEMDLPFRSPDLYVKDIRALSSQCSAEALFLKVRENREFLSPDSCLDTAILAAEKFQESTELINTQNKGGKKWKTFVHFKYHLCSAYARTLQSLTFSQANRTKESVASLLEGRDHMERAKEESEDFDRCDPESSVYLSKSEEFRRIEFLVEKRASECEKDYNKSIDQLPPMVQLLPLDTSSSTGTLDKRLFRLPAVQVDTWLNSPENERTGRCSPCCAPCTNCLQAASSRLSLLPWRFAKWVVGKSNDEEEDEERRMIALADKPEYGSR